MYCLSEVSIPGETSQGSAGFDKSELVCQMEFDKLLFLQCRLTGAAHLARDTDFPELALTDALQAASDSVKQLILWSVGPRSEHQFLGDIAPQLKLPTTDDGQVNWAAFSVLCRQSPLPDKVLQDTVLPFLKHTLGGVRQATLDVLSHQLDSSYDILKIYMAPLLKDGNFWVGSATCEALNRHSPVSDTLLKEEVLPLLKSNNVDIRWTAVELRGAEPSLSDNILMGLTPLLQSTECSVRWTALGVLHRYPTLIREIRKVILPLLKGDNAFNIAALDGQSLFHDEGIRSEVATLLIQEPTQRTILKVLACQPELPDEYLAENIVRLLETEARDAAVDVLLRQESLRAKTEQAVLRLLGNKVERVRYVTPRALGGRSSLSDRGVQIVASMLLDKDKWVQFVAEHIILRQSALPEGLLKGGILPLLTGEVARLRTTAALILRNQSGLSSNILQGILSWLDDKNRSDYKGSAIREAALIALQGPINLDQQHP
ncbi:uncharacterized protein BJX67DRAFT_385378 [Aspergillus lucknowensis]|uniref:HEAT repeat domain-containing protein n=1 Tax=Aspergillus lucknowensis TaxID=176173 RepID=A0ABR4LF18_9EURO